MTPPKIIGHTHPLLVCYPSRCVRIVLLTSSAPLLTTCKNLYSYATSPTMTENLCPDQGKKDQLMSENMTCQAGPVLVP